MRNAGNFINSLIDAKNALEALAVNTIIFLGSNGEVRNFADNYGIVTGATVALGSALYGKSGGNPDYAFAGVLAGAGMAAVGATARYMNRNPRATRATP